MLLWDGQGFGRVRWQVLTFFFYFLFIYYLFAYYLCFGYVVYAMGGDMCVRAEVQCWCFPQPLSFYFLRWDHPLNLELTLPPTLSGYLAPRIFLPLPRSSTGVGGRHHTQLSCGCRGLSSGPCASVTSAVLLCSGCALLSVSPHWGKDGLFGLSLALRDQSAISFWFQF